MADYWGDEHYRRASMEERLQEADRHRLLAAAARQQGWNRYNLESWKRLTDGARLDKTIVLGGFKVRITGG